MLRAPRKQHGTYLQQLRPRPHSPYCWRQTDPAGTGSIFSWKMVTMTIHCRFVAASPGRCDPSWTRPVECCDDDDGRCVVVVVVVLDDGCCRTQDQHSETLSMMWLGGKVRELRIQKLSWLLLSSSCRVVIRSVLVCFALRVVCSS